MPRQSTWRSNKQQLADIEKSFGALLRPTAEQDRGAESAGGHFPEPAWASGASGKTVQPGAEAKKDFYAELPIKITLTGSYHDFGAFVSGIAALPRIVTLHDITITPIDKNGGFDQLQLDVTAKDLSLSR